MKDPRRFYTYAYLRKDGSPYYIGKGCGKRAYDRKRHNAFVPSKDRILFLKQNLTEEEAFKHEKYMIRVFGRIDLGTGILYNKTDGGDGPSGYVHTKEQRKMMGEKRRGKKRPTVALLIPLAFVAVMMKVSVPQKHCLWTTIVCIM